MKQPKKFKLWSVSSSVGNFKFSFFKCQVLLLGWRFWWNNWFRNQTFSRFRLERNWGELQTLHFKIMKTRFSFLVLIARRWDLWVSFCTEMRGFPVNQKETKYKTLSQSYRISMRWEDPRLKDTIQCYAVADETVWRLSEDPPLAQIRTFHMDHIFITELKKIWQFPPKFKHTTYACSALFVCMFLIFLFNFRRSVEINLKITCDYLFCQESIVILGQA